MNGNTTKNTDNCAKWLRSQGFKQNQIISITANETTVTNGDQVMTVFYRENSVIDGDLPCDDLQFSANNPKESWELKLKEANNFKVNGQTPKIISVSRTPKNIGNARN